MIPVAPALPFPDGGDLHLPAAAGAAPPDSSLGPRVLPQPARLPPAPGGAAREDHGPAATAGPHGGAAGAGGRRHGDRAGADRPGARPRPRGPWVHGSLRAPDEEDFWSALARLEAGWLLQDSGSPREPLQAWLAAQRLAILVPVQVSDRLVGVLAFSAPLGGGLLTARDAALLADLASALALALSHALAYDTIQRMNAELELRVRERTAELEQARLQLYQADKMASVGLLAASVAHELNTPLGVVLSTAQQVAAGLPEATDPSALRRYASLAELGARAARQAASIVQNLREFSRPSQRDPEFVDLRAGLENTLAVLGPRLRRTRIEVVREFAELPRIQCFPALLNQVFMNLVLSALQSMGEEGVLTIRTVGTAAGSVRIEVQDTGSGVPPELRERVFEPFFTTKVGAGGMGLGLSLSYNIVASHGGRIFVEPSYGEGARFVIELPARLPPAAGSQAGAARP